MCEVVWREWFSARAVQKMTEMGTLPIERTEIDTDRIYVRDGEDLAKAIVERAFKDNFERFREGGSIVIIEPAEYAGAYDIEAEYEPVFYARQRDEE